MRAGAFMSSAPDAQDSPQQHAYEQAIRQECNSPMPEPPPGAETRGAQTGTCGSGSAAECRTRHEDHCDIVPATRLIGGFHEVARDLSGVPGIAFRNLTDPARGQVIAE